jgi:hypothetical protein
MDVGYFLTFDSSFAYIVHVSSNLVSVRVEVLIAMATKSSTFWNITRSSPLKVNRRFGEHIAPIFRAEE